jgi:hypothetical protein
MRPDRDRLIELIADRVPVDWAAVFDACRDDTERSWASHLRIVSNVACATAPDSEAGQPAAHDARLSFDDPEGGAAAPEGERPSLRWGHLEILGQIGRGAYGQVFRAWDPKLAREVALKILTGDDGGASWREARRLARVVHRNVVTIFGADEVDGRFGLWMELVTGRTLDFILRDQGPFSAAEAVVIGLEITEAVAAVHAAGLVHGDIKAQNVMREYAGRYVLMDMGASIDLSSEGLGAVASAGTPLYMAPELFDGAAASVSSDIYAIGVLLYRLVTAEFPVDGRTVGDLRLAHARRTPLPLRGTRQNLPPRFIDLVERCLAHDAGSRFKDIAALEHALHDLGGEPVSTRFARRRSGALGVALVVTGFALSAAVWGYRTTLLRGHWETDAAVTVMSADEYKVFAAYEDLAFARSTDDPTAAAGAAGGALAEVRQTFPGNHPMFALLYSQIASAWRHAADTRQADANARDAAVHMLYSVGEEHPYTSIVAMELARNALAAGDLHGAADQLVRALSVRERVLGLSQIAGRQLSPLDKTALRLDGQGPSLEADSDGDGLLDVVEVAIGLEPHSPDSDGDGVFDDDELVKGTVVSNRLRFGLGASPYLTWAHYGACDPRFLAWQSPARFPMNQRPESEPPRWFIGAAHGQGYFHQRLSRAQSTAAIERGYSLLVRVQPIQGQGIASIVVDTSPVGPRFDLAVQRLSPRAVEVRLLSSVLPREGTPVVVESPLGGAWPLIELRYRPAWRSAALFVNGRRLSDGYIGHHQFQETDGAVVWGIASSLNGDARAAAAFNLVWLEIS